MDQILIPMSNATLFTRRFPLLFSISLLLLITSSVPIKDVLTGDVLKYTNQFRKSRGLPALEMRNDLNAIARRYCEDMASGRRRFGHGGYSQREAQVRKLVRPFYGMGENVAYGARSGKEVVSLWKTSAGHRRNMLGNYKYIGIGTARDRRGLIYYTQIFVR
jgi:uncharacterized protein YkwD